MLFSNRDLKKLLVPLVIEQVLVMLVGMADTVMVSSVGEAAVFGVALADMVNYLVITVLTALTTGGAVILSQYLGGGQPDKAAFSAGQLMTVAYFSATNTTKPLAEYIAGGLDADIYEIVPQEPYTSADLNYNNSSSRTTAEMNDPDARPAISGGVNDMEQYDIVFIGYPIWWGQAPRIVSAFLESYDFSGKTIVPFCTSGSSGIGSSAANLHSLANGATWLDGRRFSGGTSRGAMIEWVNSLGLGIAAK